MVAAASKKKFGNVGKKKGATLRDVPANKWVKTMAAHLKQEGKLVVPKITELVKTSHGRERAPQNDDWFYIRCAAVLRRVYLRPGTGCGGLGKAFANKKNNGSAPEHTVKASRGALQWACQALQKINLVKPGKIKGRVITKEGRKKVDSVAFNVKIHRKITSAKKTVKK
jgi:small subunit ribosomal protein S19e